MYDLVYGTTGLIHLAAALLSPVTGHLILFLKKGQRFTKKIGYAYVGMLYADLPTPYELRH